MSNEFATAITKALTAATKDLAAEKKRREKDARTARRATGRSYTTREESLRDVVFAVMRRAVEEATENGKYTVPARNLYYVVRRIIQGYTDKELNYKYFTKLLTQYEQSYGAIRGLTFDPRGHLYEPHTAKEVPLGTLDVADYELPEHVFNKILYVEKEGFDPIWKESKLAERYDMAIASGKGYPVVAVRSLFARTQCDGDYRLFVLHDGDPDGYGIARTISTATSRMPHYNVEVIDLGLTVADALERDLPTETFTRSQALPSWMQSPPQRYSLNGSPRERHDPLTDNERGWFEGEHIYGSQYECTRVELNAFLVPDLIKFVEDKLAAAGADEKLIPPEDAVAAEAARAHQDAVKQGIASHLAEMFDTDTMADTIVAETEAEVIDDPDDWITQAYDDDRASYWRTVISHEVADRLDDDRLGARLVELVNSAVAEHAHERTSDAD
jgi:hypothetical protein